MTEEDDVRDLIAQVVGVSRRMVDDAVLAWETPGAPRPMGGTLSAMIVVLWDFYNAYEGRRYGAAE